uniref:Uncharacterized protein n=1 Tax=Rhizophora mucronata TaxID=61149 RepID=A0A2P2IZB1_RHIMU
MSIPRTACFIKSTYLEETTLSVSLKGSICTLSKSARKIRKRSSSDFLTT